MRVLHQLLIALFLCFLSPVTFAQSDQPSGAATSAATDPVPADGNAEYTGEQKPYYSGAFNLMVWVGGVLLGGMGTYAVFLGLHHHKRVRLAGDQHWPLLFTATVPFLIVVLPILFPGNPVMNYGEWGGKCFDRNTYHSSRIPEDDPNGLITVEKACITAQSAEGEQLSHSALGLNWVYRQYKAVFANGEGNAMFPGEMLFVLWLVMFGVGLSLYRTLLFLRQRFLVH